jgi:uncharacterized protein (TIGR03437 family)
MATLDWPNPTAQQVQATEIPWPTQLGGVRVRVNQAAAPISGVIDRLVQFQCPALPAGTTATVDVESAAGALPNSLKIAIEEATPGIYTVGDSEQAVALIAETGEIAMPVQEGSPGRPARPGELLSIFANGLGPVKEIIAPGSPAPIDRSVPTTNRVEVLFGGVPAQTSFAGLARGLIGMFQVDTRLPDDVPTGTAVPISLRVHLSDGSVLESNIARIAIFDRDR